MAPRSHVNFNFNGSTSEEIPLAKLGGSETCRNLVGVPN
jgi:hypothetical protein